MVNKSVALCAIMALLAFAVAEVREGLPRTMRLFYSNPAAQSSFAVGV
jgi:hypothetical protein